LKSIKKSIYDRLLNLTETKIKNLKTDIDSTITSRNTDTKSSAGDKHETSRAKIQIEIDQLSKQLSILNQQHQILLSINIKKENKKIGVGSLVYTNAGAYFVGIGLGKIQLGEKEYYGISLASPIGRILKDKIVGDEFIFNSNNYKILDIY